MANRQRQTIRKTGTRRQTVIRVHRTGPSPPSPPPKLDPRSYLPDETRQDQLFFGLESFAKHMTDEGWQLQEGLRLAGYEMWGRGYPNNSVDVPQILKQRRVKTAIMQDKREWDAGREGCLDKHAAFLHSQELRRDRSIFRVTVLKDAHQDAKYHADAADEIGCHAWITYYLPDAVARLAPYVRRQHLIRTYHTVDAAAVPPYNAEGRRCCLLSGAVRKDVYPLRHRLSSYAEYLPIEVKGHPGYHADGPETPDFLYMLSQYRIAICTASIYNYALRKIIEATACGCVVITDLGDNDPLPEIDGNLVRVPRTIPLHEMRELILNLSNSYDPVRQAHFAEKAKAFYDYRVQGCRLAQAIESMRLAYAGATS